MKDNQVLLLITIKRFISILVFALGVGLDELRLGSLLKVGMLCHLVLSSGFAVGLPQELEPALWLHNTNLSSQIQADLALDSMLVIEALLLLLWGSWLGHL